MSDPARQRFASLMAEIELLEEQIEELQRQASGPETAALEQEIAGLQRTLAERRTELTRISDGCGRPHPMA